MSDPARSYPTIIIIIIITSRTRWLYFFFITISYSDVFPRPKDFQ